MRLNVPLVRQPKDSLDCGLAGVSMFLKYYKLDIPFNKIRKDIKVHKIGTYAPQLGVYLIKKGFDVEIITMHPGLFTIKDRNLSQNQILSRFKKLLKKTKSKDNRISLGYFVDFIKKGGKVKIKIPNKEDINEEIKNKRPMCALMTTNLLYHNKPSFNFHFNVITGIDSKNIYTNDPAWDHRGGKNKYGIQDFFYCLYASIYGGLDNGSLVKIRKST